MIQRGSYVFQIGRAEIIVRENFRVAKTQIFAIFAHSKNFEEKNNILLFKNTALVTLLLGT